jgi:predicted phosphodiesterase
MLLAAPAFGANTISPSFDGARNAPPLETLKQKADLPEIKGKPVEPPEDLRKAKETWGTDAQSRMLDRLHPSPKSSFKFAVIGDIENGRFPWQRIFAPKGAAAKQIAAIHAASADFILQLGDFVSKGTVKNYRAYVKFLKDSVSIPMFHVIGNHDRSKPNGKADKNMYSAVFGDGDYVRDYNGWRFVAVDTSDYALRDDQLDWLDRVLDTDKKTVVATHIVPKYLKNKLYSIGPGPGAQGALIPEAFFEPGAKRFGEILARRGVERVYLGHIHAFGIGHVNGVKYVLTAGGGSPLYPLPPSYPKRRKAHWLLVEADGSGLRETVHELDGTSFPITW